MKHFGLKKYKLQQTDRRKQTQICKSKQQFRCLYLLELHIHKKPRSSRKFLVILHPLGQGSLSLFGLEVLFILFKSKIWLATVLLAQVASLFTLFSKPFFATFPLLFPFDAFLRFLFVFAIRVCNSRNFFLVQL